MRNLLNKRVSNKIAYITWTCSLLVGIISGCVADKMTSPIIIDSTNLGTMPTSTLIVSSTGPNTTGPLSVTLAVTPGAMYVLQLTDIKGNVVRSTGFTAVNTTEVKELNYSDVQNGSYDLSLMDINGRLMKVPVLIQH